MPITKSSGNNFIFGQLLGDGSIYCNKTKNPIRAVYGHGDKHLDYIIWLRNQFENMGFKQSGKIRKFSNINAYQFRTLSYEELYEIRCEFYSYGKKRIPTWLEINPTILKYWYIGNGNNSRYPLIDSGIFSLPDMEKFLAPLRDFGINYTLISYANRNRFYVCAKSTDKFFDYCLLLDKEIPPDYKYKFRRN